MKFAILQHHRRWDADKMQELLIKKGHSCDIIDVHSVSDLEYDVFLNRVHASDANDDPNFDFSSYISLLKGLEQKGKMVINSSTASTADYSKQASFELMDAHNIPTPFTEVVNDAEEAKAVIAKKGLSYPVILKYDAGGCANGVCKINSEEELNKKLVDVSYTKDRTIILQEFIQPVKNHDIRIGIIGGEVAFSYKRSLVDNWLASISKGSVIETHEPSQEEIDLAIKASESINADINEVDMCFSIDGPVIIENNPTPSYSAKKREAEVEKIIDLICQKVAA